MARYLAALLGGGANERGSMLRPATCSRPCSSPTTSRIRASPGVGLAFFRSATRAGIASSGTKGSCRLQLGALAGPDEGVGVIALTNGSSGAPVWLPTEVRGLLHHLLGVPDEGVRSDIPHHPEIWSDICGHYQLPEGISISAGG